jgi:hypothetical protein
MNLPDFLALQNAPTQVLSPVVEQAFATENHRLLYRSYERDYLDFLRSEVATDPMTGFQQVAERYKRDIGRPIYDALYDWQGSTQGSGPMGLKIKAAEMEPGWGAEVIFKKGSGPSMERMVEAAAQITDEQYLRVRAFNQAFLMDKGTESVSLLRGTGGRTGDKIVQAILAEGSDVTEIVIKDANLAGYTPLLNKAGDFGHLEGGVTARVEFTRQQVFVTEDLFYKITFKYEEEREWITFGGERIVHVDNVMIPGSDSFGHLPSGASIAEEATVVVESAKPITTQDLMDMFFGKDYNKEDMPF